MTVPLLGGSVVYCCPNCTSELGLEQPPTKPVLHPCRGMKGLLVPMVPRGTKANLEVVEREDYIGSERVQTDGEGRPVMSVVTTRDDGQDCTVYAPMVTARREELE